MSVLEGAQNVRIEGGSINSDFRDMTINDFTRRMTNYDSFNATNRSYSHAYNSYSVNADRIRQFFLILELRLKFECLFCDVYRHYEARGHEELWKHPEREHRGKSWCVPQTSIDQSHLTLNRYHRPTGLFWRARHPSTAPRYVRANGKGLRL